VQETPVLWSKLIPWLFGKQAHVKRSFENLGLNLSLNLDRVSTPGISLDHRETQTTSVPEHTILQERAGRARPTMTASWSAGARSAACRQRGTGLSRSGNLAMLMVDPAGFVAGQQIGGLHT
jgi:hypothetical protein